MTVTQAGTRVGLDPPVWVRAEPGGHQVTLTWATVPGAAGYRVYAADSRGGDYRPLDHAVSDALVVPHPPYADTTGTPAVARWYRVATVDDVRVTGELSDAVSTAPLSGASVPVVVEVDASGPAGDLPVELSGDGAGSLVEAVAATGESGDVTVRTWSHTPGRPRASQVAGLARRVRVDLSGLPGGAAYAVRHRQGEASESTTDVTADAEGRLSIELDLPMPATSLLTLVSR